MTSTTYRLIGTTDDVVDCAKCGKPDLRMTVILELLDAHGESEGVTYYGSTCAARALAARGVRVTPAKIRDAATAAQRRRLDEAMNASASLSYYGFDHAGDIDPELWERAVQRHAEGNRIAFRNNPSLRPAESLLRCVTSWRAAVAAIA